MNLKSDQVPYPLTGEKMDALCDKLLELGVSEDAICDQVLPIVHDLGSRLIRETIMYQKKEGGGAHAPVAGENHPRGVLHAGMDQRMDRRVHRRNPGQTKKGGLK